LQWSGEGIANCVREPDFQEIYSVLGNREAQDRIRDANPGVKHCHLLIKNSPSYCTSCPNNPYLNTALAGKIKHVEEYGPLAQEILGLYSLSRSGVVRKEDLTAVGLQALMVAGPLLMEKDAMIQGQYIAAEVSKILAAAFGAK